MLRITKRASAESNKSMPSDHRIRIEIETWLANAYRMEDQLDDAETLELKNLQTSQSKFGPNHSTTLRVMRSLSWTYCEQGRYDEALELQTQGLDAAKSAFRPDTGLISSFVTSLATTYRLQGRLQDAKALYLEYLPNVLQLLQERHPYMLRVMVNIAITMGTSRACEAERLLLEVLKFCRITLRETHPQTTTSMLSLATLKLKQKWLSKFDHLPL